MAADEHAAKRHPYEDAEAFDYRLARAEALRLAVETTTAEVPSGMTPSTPLTLRLAEVYEAWLVEPDDTRDRVVAAAAALDAEVAGGAPEGQPGTAPGGGG